MNAIQLLESIGEQELEKRRLELEKVRLRLEEDFFLQQREWERENSEFRKLSREWRKVEDKRRRVSEKLAQLSLLVKISSLLGGFQVALYINQGMPALTDAWEASPPLAPSSSCAPPPPPPLSPAAGAIGSSEPQAAALREGRGITVWDGNGQLHDSVLVLWAVTCMLAILLNLCVMIVAGLLHLSVVLATYKEPDLRNKDINTIKRYSDDTASGLIVTQEDFLKFWRLNCDRKFVRILRIFSWGIPLYCVSIALGAVIKFYMSATVACLCLLPPLSASVFWRHYHKVLLSYIIHRREEEPHAREDPNASIAQHHQAHLRREGRGEGHEWHGGREVYGMHDAQQPGRHRMYQRHERREAYLDQRDEGAWGYRGEAHEEEEGSVSADALSAALSAPTSPSAPPTPQRAAAPVVVPIGEGAVTGSF